MEYKDNHILRLIHFDNLEDTLKNGMYSKNSGHVIPNYTNIGDTTLIKQGVLLTGMPRTILPDSSTSPMTCPNWIGLQFANSSGMTRKTIWTE